MFKSFYVHEQNLQRNRNKHNPRGFTVKVSPDPDNSRNCIIQGTWCSGKDQFIKSEGRKYAEAAEKVIINKRDLPNWLARMYEEIIPVDKYPQRERVYYYLLKYVV